MPISENILKQKFKECDKKYSGKVFGRWSVIKLSYCVEKASNGWSKYFKCKCSCGKIRYRDISSLVKGNSISCGCYRDENNKIVLVKHSKNKLLDILNLI